MSQQPAENPSAGPSLGQAPASPTVDRSAPDRAPAVVLHEVSKGYGHHPVLRGLDLEIPAGVVTAVLGPSGGGKTTLLRLLAGFERAATGSITLHGTVVDDDRRHVAPEHRRIGYVPQEGGLFPHLSVAANVGFGLARSPARNQRVAELLELVGLPDLGRRHPHQLSGGQQQRVALARALAPDPALVLLDEPFSALDAGLRAEVRADVAAVLRAVGTTAVLVTHDQDEALSMAELVAVLHDGRIIQAASPDTLYRRPATTWVARFIGAANLLPAHVHGRTARCALGELPLLTDTPRLPADAVVMIRPEQLRLTPTTRSGAATAPATTGFRARVVDRSYHGHDTLLTLAPHSSTSPDTFSAATIDADQTGGAQLLARVHESTPPPVGALVTVTVIGEVTALPA